MTSRLDDFLDKYGRYLNMSFEELWCASPSKAQREIDEVAQRRVTPVTHSELKLQDVLLPSQLQFMKGYASHQQALKERGVAFEDSFWAVDLDHNPAKRCRCSHTSPSAGFNPMFCLIGHGTIVGMASDTDPELLTALEQLVAMGIPAFGELKEEFGCPVDFEHLLMTRQITHSAVRSMAGNGWQLMPVGLLYMHIFGKIEFFSDSIFTPSRSISQGCKGTAITEKDSEDEDDQDDVSTVYSFPQHWTDDMSCVQNEDDLEHALKQSLYMDGPVTVIDDSQPSDDALCSASCEESMDLDNAVRSGESQP